ncbi:hypothetical protein GCM10020256_40600 [Streptomyces thermocoprophilus]
MLRALPTRDGADESRPEKRGSRTDLGFQVPYAVAPQAASRARARPPEARARRGAAVDGEAQGGSAGDDGGAGAQGEVEGAVFDVVGDLVLEAGEAFGVVDEGLGAVGVELVDVDVEAKGGVVAVQVEGAERGDVDLRAAGEGGAEGHRRVHGADGDADIADDEEAEPGAEEDDGDESEGVGEGVAGGVGGRGWRGGVRERGGSGRRGWLRGGAARAGMTACAGITGCAGLADHPAQGGREVPG